MWKRETLRHKLIPTPVWAHTRQGSETQKRPDGDWGRCVPGGVPRSVACPNTEKAGRSCKGDRAMLRSRTAKPSRPVLNGQLPSSGPPARGAGPSLAPFPRSSLGLVFLTARAPYCPHLVFYSFLSHLSLFHLSLCFSQPQLPGSLINIPVSSVSTSSPSPFCLTLLPPHHGMSPCVSPFAYFSISL